MEQRRSVFMCLLLTQRLEIPWSAGYLQMDPDKEQTILSTAPRMNDVQWWWFTKI
jgi:hypothetical protein